MTQAWLPLVARAKNDRTECHGVVRRDWMGGMGEVITANRLRDGAVVFLGTDFSWVEHIGVARVFATAETTAAGLAATKKDADDNLVLDIYAIDVTEKDGSITPVRLREAIRATGPTIHPEHGKGSASGKRG